MPSSGVILLDRVIRRPDRRTDWFTHLVLEELNVASIAVCCSNRDKDLFIHMVPISKV